MKVERRLESKLMKREREEDKKVKTQEIVRVDCTELGEKRPKGINRYRAML